MTTATITLVDFLTARIDADEELASHAERGPWTSFPSERDDRFAHIIGGPTVKHVADMVTPSTTRHIVRWNPDRVLAECEKNRLTLAEHAPFDNPAEHGSGVYCRMCVNPAGWPLPPRSEFGTRFPCRTLRLLALPYADHPDYRDEWRP